MSSDIIGRITAIVAAIIGLATLSVILSKQSNSAGVIGALSQGLAADIKAATSPIGGFTGF